VDVRAHNRAAWDHRVDIGNRWTVPVSPDEIAAARRGQFQVLLTPTKPVPSDWFSDDLKGIEVLCLASGGGQQGPILAAAGAKVTVFDNSPRQLAQDRRVAEREGLSIHTVEGDMRDLSALENDHFDLIFHPVSNVFVPDVRPIWLEAYRVLRTGGSLLAGFTNPFLYLFDDDLAQRNGVLQVRYALPYSDLESLDKMQREALIDAGETLEFSHTLEAQIGGQLEAGFILTDFYEDRFGEEAGDLLSKFAPTFIATRAIKTRIIQ
jgi:SAM-dependent methyltransferase